MSYLVTILPRRLFLNVEDHETILEAAQTHGVTFPYGCDAGACYVCAGALESGSVHLRIEERNITAGEEDADDVLFCLAQPTSDCRIIMEGVLAPGEYPMINASCQVTQVTPFGNDTVEVTLRLPAGKKVEFHPGQYLQVILDKDTHCAFSIGNIPNQERIIQLYVGFSDKDETSHRLREAFTVGNVVNIDLPHGRCYLQDTKSTQPLYLIAGSTGISQIKSIAEQCIADQLPRDVHIYWGVPAANGLFLDRYFQRIANDNDHVHYTAVVSEPDDEWQGRTGFVHKAMLEDTTGLENAEIILCGSPGMTYAVLDDLLAQGVKEEQVQSDVFEYAPR
ncbi:hypothetical protein A9Q99_14180 [Gammaproteobacteria bacterium 45_16_T64]|nr:hypothetical protein A9Q99_14180 [Gammaproteobacteria bacterium 45_16_T64]